MRSPRVFISYSHDSDAHQQQVGVLWKELRENGIDARFDQKVNAPPEGWPQWMLNQIEQADYVLVVCTEVYHRRYSGKDSGSGGLGSRWEGAIINYSLYEQGGRNDKFLPVVFDGADKAHIPTIMRQYTHYVMFRDLMKLIANITDQPLVEDVPLGDIPEVKPISFDSASVVQVESNPGPEHVRQRLTNATSGKITYDFLLGDGPVRFEWADLRKVITTFHDAIHERDVEGASQFDFTEVDIQKKNELNRVSENYFEMMRDRHEPFFGRIDSFLSQPVNHEVKQLYHEVVDELRTKMAVEEKQFEGLEHMLLAFADAAVSSYPDRLNGHQSTLRVLLSFMYFNCDIGRKA
jgi:hypothetical protein